jgi:hypothetical protein
MKKVLLAVRPSLHWGWRNRKSILTTGFGLILLCKWAFGYVSTDKLIELVKALGSVFNPII